MLFTSNKYTNWYYQIIESARQNPPSGYYENHHIIPRSLGGSNDPENIVSLTARQHFICHMLLTKMTKGQARYKMAYAIKAMAMTNKRPDRYINARLYEYLKPLVAEAISQNNTGQAGKPKPAEQRRKMSESAKLREEKRRQAGWKMPKESVEQALVTKNKRIESGEINPYSAARNAKMSATKKGTKRQYLPDGSFIMVKPD